MVPLAPGGPMDAVGSAALILCNTPHFVCLSCIPPVLSKGCSTTAVNHSVCDMPPLLSHQPSPNRAILVCTVTQLTTLQATVFV